jgi:hypothetical protein
MKIDNFICEICQQDIKKLEPHVRFGGDSVVINSDGTYGSLINNQVIIMAAFHNQCIIYTYNQELDLNYINEARLMVSSIEVNQEKTEKRSAKLVCLSGGLDS